MAELRADGDSEQAGERNSQKRRRHHTEPGPDDEGAGDDDPLDDGHRDDDDDAPWDDLEDDSGFLPDDDLQDGPGSETEELHLPGATGEFMGDGEAPVASEEDGRQTSGKPRKKKRRKSGPAKLPGLELLTPAGPETQPLTTAELDAAADLLEATLRSFGVEGEVKDVRPGPVVTTFEFQPGIGIKVSQIVQRSDDLALAMRARSLRMEAPIPGKAAVGIEIPNPVARMVRLREVLELVDDSDRDPPDRGAGQGRGRAPRFHRHRFAAPPARGRQHRQRQIRVPERHDQQPASAQHPGYPAHGPHRSPRCSR
jgi:DNA segregation ATPase FtsK/SpoIIIE-like protein